MGRAAQDPQALQPGLAIMLYVRGGARRARWRHGLLDELTGIRGGLGSGLTFGAPIHVVWAAGSMVSTGRRAEADIQLRLASAAFRRLRATRFLHQADALLARTA